ncbi:MAG: hypothetical protein LBO03_05410 [Acidaminococcales bacterium]|jgi:hypothetical protein|nr:hypothetical protein [Acidaminococcales bacterium]
MKKIFAVICLCLSLFLGNFLLVDAPGAEAATTIFITQVSPEWISTTTTSADYIPVQGNSLPTGRYLAGDVLRFQVKFTDLTPNPTFTLFGSNVPSSQVTEISSSVSGNVTTKTYQISGMVNRANLTQNPAVDNSFGLGVWQWSGATKIAHTITIRYRRYIDWP